MTEQELKQKIKKGKKTLRDIKKRKNYKPYAGVKAVTKKKRSSGATRGIAKDDSLREYGKNVASNYVKKQREIAEYKIALKKLRNGGTLSPKKEYKARRKAIKKEGYTKRTGYYTYTKFVPSDKVSRIKAIKEKYGV